MKVFADFMSPPAPVTVWNFRVFRSKLYMDFYLWKLAFIPPRIIIYLPPSMDATPSLARGTGNFT